MKTVTRAARLAMTLLIVAWTVAPANAADLKQETLRAWQNYVQSAEEKTQDRANSQPHFLRVDESPDQADRTRSGEPLIEGSGPYKVPHGLVHDWTGTIFIPNVTISSVLQVLAQYDRYQQFYRPLVAASASIGGSPTQDLMTLTMVQRAFSVTAAVKIEDEARTIVVNPERAYLVSRSVQVREIANYGRSDEYLFQEGKGPGYVWQTFTITRLEQRDGGVFIEMETLELSRGIPFEFSWLLGPLTEKLPRAIMTTMLNDTKTAVEREEQSRLKAVAAPSPTPSPNVVPIRMNR